MPQDPDHENARDASHAAEEAAWRSIVENFGDRAELDEHDDPVDRRHEVPGSPRELFVAPEPEPRDEEHFVPPPPPPVPYGDPARVLAWFGLVVVPFAVLIAVTAGLGIPDWLGLILMVWFVGGFVFLVASMRSEPRDDNDDGAVL